MTARQVTARRSDGEAAGVGEAGRDGKIGRGGETGGGDGTGRQDFGGAQSDGGQSGASGGRADRGQGTGRGRPSKGPTGSAGKAEHGVGPKSRAVDAGETARPEPAGLGARRLAVRLIDAVTRSGRSLEDALDQAETDASLVVEDPRDRGFARLIAATVLRRKGSLEAVLAKFMDRPLPATAARATTILLAGAAQILLIGTPAHAAINLAVEQAGRDPAAQRFAKLTNAVLRRVAKDGAAVLADLDTAKLDIPEWMLDRWRRFHGEAVAADIARASLAEAPLDLSVKLPEEAEEWARRLNAQLLTTGSLRLAEHGRIEELDGFAEGGWWVQDAAAALPARLLGDVRGLEVADICAAPGGKTAALAARGAKVVAVDASAKRLERLTANMARLGLGDRVEVVAAKVETWEPGRLFDGALLDAPCTATGTIRRHPDILHLKRGSDAGHLAALQKQLIGEASRHVRPGGLLVYCVCSLEANEGPEVVAEFLASHPGFERLPVAADEIGGEAAWITGDGDLRTLPCHQPVVAGGVTGELAPGGGWLAAGGGLAAGGMDGFYAARLRRVA